MAMKTQFSSIIALERAASLTGRELEASLRKVAPGFPLTIDLQGSDDVEPTLITVNDMQLAILNIAAPAPAGTFDGAASPNMLWPSAPQELAKHKAHIMVVSPDEVETRGEVLARATLVTLVTAAIAAITPAIGVYWPASENLLSKTQFLEATKKIGAAEGVPTEIWVRLYLAEATLGAAGEQVLMTVTRGLRNFVGRDIEFSPGQMPIDKLVYDTLDFATYLINTGRAFKNGDTAGSAESPAFRVQLAENGQLGDGPVYLIGTPAF